VAAAQAFSTTAASPIFGPWYHVADVTQAEAEASYAAYADVVEPNYVLTAEGDPLASQQYQLTMTHAVDAWPRVTGTGVTIAVIDTGVDCRQQDLAAHCKAGTDYTGAGSSDDNNGHGTHVAGIAAAVGNNGVGGSGIAPDAFILPVKVLGADGSGTLDHIAAGMVWAAQHGARVENLSLGCDNCPSQLMQDAVAQAHALGTAVIVAAGNSNTNSLSTPARYAVGVAALDANSNRASFSNWGDNAKVAAPGVSILSTCRGGTEDRYCTMSGTSMASPVAAGATALLAHACPACAASQLELALVGGADAITTDRPVGGRLNVLGSLTFLPGAGPTPPQATPTSQPPPSGDYAAQVIDGINQQRAQAGLAPLRTDTRLNGAADWHNRYMASNDCFAHICPGEPGPGQRASNAGYPSSNVAENIAAGYITPQDVIVGWMGSAGHRAAILGSYADVGCAYLWSAAGGSYTATIEEQAGPASYATYWTCDFGGTGSTTPQPTQPPTSNTPHWDAGGNYRYQPFRLLNVPLTDATVRSRIHDWAYNFDPAYNTATPGFLFKDGRGNMTPNNTDTGAATVDIVTGMLWAQKVDQRLTEIERLTGLRSQWGSITWRQQGAGE